MNVQIRKIVKKICTDIVPACSYKFVGECAQINQVSDGRSKSEKTKENHSRQKTQQYALQILRFTHASLTRYTHTATNHGSFYSPKSHPPGE